MVNYIRILPFLSTYKNSFVYIKFLFYIRFTYTGGTKMARLENSYAVGVGLQPTLPPPVIATAAPGASNIKFPLGQVWLDINNGQSYILNNINSGSATWNLMAPGASDVDTITADSGGALSPAAGNITIAGGTNVTTAGAGSTVTVNLDAAIALATSVTAPIYTTSAADMNINAAANQDVIMQMGDAGGTNKISFEDSASSEVASLDSDGTLTVVNMDGIIGATTPAAGAFTTVVAGTSAQAPLYTAGAGVDLDVTVPSGQDMVVKMGDAAGANKISFTDSADSEVALLDSDGNMTIDGNLILNTVATQIQMNGGAVTDFIGQATLAMGTVTVANTNIAAGDRILLTRADLNSSTALGELTITAQTASTSFVITAIDPSDGTSTIAGDTSIVNYVIIRQN